MTMGSRATSVRSVAYIEKSSQYQKYITLSSVILIITSTILIFTAVTLMKFYHLDKLGFWSSYFEFVPYYMLVLGLYSFLLGLFGAFVSGSGSKGALMVFALLMVIAFFAQLGSIFTALEVRSAVENDDQGDQLVFNSMAKVSFLLFTFFKSIAMSEHFYGPTRYLKSMYDLQKWLFWAK